VTVWSSKVATIKSSFEGVNAIAIGFGPTVIVLRSARELVWYCFTVFVLAAM